MKSAAPSPSMLHCSILGAAIGATTCAALLRVWPAAPGVVWTPEEHRLVAVVGIVVGALTGGLLGLGTRRAGRLGTVVAGLVPAAAWAVLPLLPVQGRNLVRLEPAAVGMWLGGALLVWGLVRMVRRPLVHGAVGSLLILATLALIPRSTETRARAGDTPDLWLITVDTTRADLVPGFGGDLTPAPMPFMSAWSESARRFQRAYAPTALTGPAHTSILSGQHVLDHGILANGRDIPEDLAWVPEALQARGWHTRARVSAAVLDDRLGFSRGFDTYDAMFERRLQYGHPLLAVLPRKRVGGTGFVRPDARTVDLILDAPPSTRPTFTWVHLYGPHWPYTPDPGHAAALGIAPSLDVSHHGPVPLNHAAELPEATRAHAIALYRAELRSLDDQLARLLSRIPGDARVVVVADHGESLDEHGLLFNHGRLTTTPSTRVPLWVRGPGYPPGADDRTVSIHQVAATLMHLAGVSDEDFGVPLHDTPTDAVAVSVASAAVFRDDDAPFPGSLGGFSALSVRSGTWSKSASIWHAPHWSDLAANPREEVRPDASAPAMSVEVAPIEARWATLSSREPEAPTEVSAESRAALEALGYLEPSPHPAP